MLLKELLKSKGVKQNWLAQRIGVSTVTVSNWVKGKSYPSKKNLLKLSEVLNVHLNDLVNKW
jgi:transcriptional regulator with XRE-family HTH domain